MLEAIKKLLENNVINEDMHDSIQSAWTTKLTEAREGVKVELREEFAQRYEHDKTVMVEALDKMMTDNLKQEIVEFKEEKSEMANDRVKAQRKLTENASKFSNFMTAKLAEEITELRNDRQVQMEGMKQMEGFIAKHLSKEIVEFAEDKRDLVETKVKLVAEANQKLTAIKKKFVAESSKKVRAHVITSLKGELTSLNEDIKAARENSFGRRLFEAFSSEFTSTHLNENAVIRDLRSELAQKNKKINESLTIATKFKQLNESKKKQIRIIKEDNTRIETLDELLRPLNEEKAKIMENLLESVQTNRLQRTFEKYLPAVMANKQVQQKLPAKRRKQALNESVRSEHTGNKTVKPSDFDRNNNIVDIMKLAGLKN